MVRALELKGTDLKKQIQTVFATTARFLDLVTRAHIPHARIYTTQLPLLFFNLYCFSPNPTPCPCVFASSHIHLMLIHGGVERGHLAA
jgi:hypothetical protein